MDDPNTQLHIPQKPPATFSVRSSRSLLEKLSRSPTEGALSPENWLRFPVVCDLLDTGAERARRICYETTTVMPLPVLERYHNRNEANEPTKSAIHPCYGHASRNKQSYSVAPLNKSHLSHTGLARTHSLLTKLLALQLPGGLILPIHFSAKLLSTDLPGSQ